MDVLQHHLATTLREQRLQRGWSLSQAAQMTGVSKAMLGQIERAESSPTIATLWKIATGFNLPFSTFIEPAAGDSGQPRRESALPGYSAAGNGMQAISLFPFDPDLGFEMLVIALAPGALSVSDAHERGVTEHVIVLEGGLELVVDGQQHYLAPGEALRFQADCAHSYHNGGSEIVRFHDLIHYPRR